MLCRRKTKDSGRGCAGSKDREFVAEANFLGGVYADPYKRSYADFTQLNTVKLTKNKGN